MKKKWFAVVLFSFLLMSANASFLTHKEKRDSASAHTPLSTKNIETLIGRKLSLKEKIILFFVKPGLKKEKAKPEPDFDKLKEKANKNASLSLTFAILSFLTPLFLIPAIIFRDDAEKHTSFLTPSSKKKLKWVKRICTFWTIVLILAAIAVFLGILAILIWFHEPG